MIDPKRLDPEYCIGLNPECGIAVFTDGSCHAKDRIGGWAWVAIDAFDGYEFESGYVKDTTINRMELYAVNMALDALDDLYGSQDILVHSDSEYVVLGFAHPSRKRSKNIDWWKGLDQKATYHNSVTLTHVRGHDGNEFNEIADKLAHIARKEGQSELLTDS